MFISFCLAEPSDFLLERDFGMLYVCLSHGLGQMCWLIACPGSLFVDRLVDVYVMISNFLVSLPLCQDGDCG